MRQQAGQSHRPPYARPNGLGQPGGWGEEEGPCQDRATVRGSSASCFTNPEPRAGSELTGSWLSFFPGGVGDGKGPCVDLGFTTCPRQDQNSSLISERGLAGYCGIEGGTEHSRQCSDLAWARVVMQSGESRSWPADPCGTGPPSNIPVQAVLRPCRQGKVLGFSGVK